jgi:hypothetical protein
MRKESQEKEYKVFYRQKYYGGELFLFFGSSK